MTELFGCTNVISSKELLDVAWKLTEIPSVESHMACLHFCKFGTESSCNFVELNVETQTCTLAAIPPNQYLQLTFSPDLNKDRVMCMVTGIWLFLDLA